MNVTLMGSGGPVSATIVGEVNVSGRPMFIVDFGVGAIVKGVFCKLFVVHPHEIIGRQVDDIRVKEEQDERQSEPSETL